MYNRLLEEKIEYYQETGKYLRNTPAHLKTQYPWLRELDSLALANAQLREENAYRSFFRDKSNGFPEFKSKRNGKQS